MGMQSQNISKDSPTADFEISHILEFSILLNIENSKISKLHEGFGAKTVFLCQNWPINCQNTNTLYRFPNFKSPFFIINFSSIAIFQERNVRFQKKKKKKKHQN